MRIANIMLGRGLGGIEQAFLDYTEGLKRAGHEPIAVTHPKAAVNRALPALGVSHVTLPNWGPWDPLAPKKLAASLDPLRAESIIAHGNRAIVFSKKASGGRLPVIAVAHNYRFRQLTGVDAVFAITRHMAQAIERETRLPRERIWYIPNMINMRVDVVRGGWQNPPVIGALGRFVAKKGFDVFLQALSALKQRGVAFQARIGGSGEEASSLRQLAAALGLEGDVRFTGWVGDPMEFMANIDMFCLPSHHEPFGIVLLEAMSAKLPVISTDSEGPSEILEHGVTGLIVPRGDPMHMADAIQAMLADETGARRLGVNAHQHVKNFYEMDSVAAYMSEILRQACATHMPVHVSRP